MNTHRAIFDCNFKFQISNFKLLFDFKFQISNLKSFSDFRFQISNLKSLFNFKSQILNLRLLSDFRFQISNLKSQISNLKFIRVHSCSFAAKIFLLFLLFSSVAHAQEAPSASPSPTPITAQNFHQWGAVTLFNGLPSDNVRAIAQTPDGVLWFGTDNGLTRFDGRRVQTIALETIEASKILALEVARDGTLWVGTERGAYYLENENFKKIEETANFAITAILPRENVYLGSADGVVFRLTAGNENSLAVEKITAEALVGSDGKPLKITGLIQTGGTLVAGTRSRSILVFENNQFYETFSRPRPFFVNALAQDASGTNAWLGADARNGESGFFSLRDIGRPEKIGADLGNVLAIEADAGGAWVGTQSKGLFYFRGAQQLRNFTFENTAGGLRSNAIYALFVDREGVLWIGTNRGVSRFDASSPFNRTLSAENSNANFVRTLYQSRNGRIFAGTNRGLYEFDGAGNWFEIPSFAARVVYTISENSQNQTLFATASGLFSADGKQILAGDVRCAVEFQGKTYTAVFGRGIVQIDGAFQMPIFNHDAPTALFADAEKLWIGTAKGEIFTFDGKETRQEKSFDALRESAIRKIAKDAEGSLWLAGTSGLFRLKNGELENVIANREVRDFLASGAEIWAATLNGGLVHVRFDETFGWITAALNVEQGLPSEQIFALLKQENQLLIGTNRGVVTYTPSAIPPQIIASRILSQRLHNAEEAARTIQLEYPQNSILVEVAGLSSRTFPEQFQYAFFLKNASGDVVLEKRLSSDTQFAPANLDAGEYQIEARAFNKDLLASEPLIIRFSIEREPFPWGATALGVLLAIALIALIWAIVERKRLAMRNRELAAARFDLANEAERERKRIARDLHDQTLADLRNLMLKTDKLPQDTSDFRSEIESVSTEIRRICEDLSPSVLENVGLVAALEFLLSHTIENYKFSAAENLEEKLNFSPNAQMQIYRIAQEILNNIKQHSDADAVEMKIEISAETEEFILSISDNGTPFEPAAKTARGRGISNVKSRAALIKAKVQWQTNETDNTLFELTCQNRPR